MLKYCLANMEKRHFNVFHVPISKTTVIVQLLVLLRLTFTSGETYYALPTTSIPCPEEGVPCFTLSQYASKSSTDYFASNTTLLLLPGNHSLDLVFLIREIESLSIVTSNMTTHSDTMITCNQAAMFVIENIGLVSIRGLTLFGCVSNQVILVEKFTLKDCSLRDQGHTKNGKGLTLDMVSNANIVNSSISLNTYGTHDSGGGINVNTSRNVTISNSTFTSNRVYVIADLYSAGIVVYAYMSNVVINTCTFTNNTLRTRDGSARTNGAVVSALSSNITINNSTFFHNSIAGPEIFGLGVGVSASHSNITINNCIFTSNSINAIGYGGYATGAAIYAISCNMITSGSTFINNYILCQGGTCCGAAVSVESSTVTIALSTFNNNHIRNLYSPGRGEIDERATGGAVYSSWAIIVISSCTFTRNSLTATFTGWGGALYADTSYITIQNSIFTNNAIVTDNPKGGAVTIVASFVTITSTTFTSNTVGPNGYSIGAALVVEEFTLTLFNCTFANNSVSWKGAALYLSKVNVTSMGYLNIQNNSAITGALYAIQSTICLCGSTTVSNNYGSLFIHSSNITFSGRTNITNNMLLSNTAEEGGAITVFQSELFVTGTTSLMCNKARNGGAISITESKAHVYGNTTIAFNTASISGGGIYAYQSEIDFYTRIDISRNSATQKGGGIYAISSTTRLREASKTYVGGNHARRGGGMCLEMNAKIYFLKPRFEALCGVEPVPWIELHFTENSAKYGGAIYITDETNSGSCYSKPYADEESAISSECFIQSLQTSQFGKTYCMINTVNTYFERNNASLAGDILYGGLLDRCSMSPFSEYPLMHNQIVDIRELFGLNYFMMVVTNVTAQELNSTKVISSDSVRVCFCRDGCPDCNYKPPDFYVKKGETFTVSLVAVDQVNNTIPSITIHGYASLQAKLGEGQSSQQTNPNGNCKELTYILLSPHNTEQLRLYVEGPCMDNGISAVNLTVNIAPCPIGFTTSNLRCDCDPFLYHTYISNCSIDSDSVQRKDNVWFSYANSTDHQGYIFHRHCPYDYCYLPSSNINVNLNIHNGADAMCAFNRSGKLCGSCEEGLSLSLGSSRCKSGSNRNLFPLLIVFATLGVVLVTFLLLCNLTVAVGTINGLIFYANIFAANRAIFFPFNQSSILTVFIAWLNLDFGFETCFYHGMDGYVKTWLQLAFPLYIVSLVIAVIVISDYSSKFAALFSGKNPVATLATLILLSYTKLLRTIITSLSFTRLEYSDGSHEMVWLADASVPYLKGKHIPLFITALIIVTVGILYTSLLFGWQWLVHCPTRGPLKWILTNTKIIAFMDAYHNPYNKDHRYWIGLLLLVRVFIYLVRAANVLGDPRINLLTINCVLVSLVFFQRAAEFKHKMYKTWMIYAFESVSFFNLVVLISVTFFITENQNSQAIVAYVSTSITFLTFLAILVYHSYIMFKLKRLLQKFLTKQQYVQLGTAESHFSDGIAAEQELLTATVIEIDGNPEPIESDEGSIVDEPNTDETDDEDHRITPTKERIQPGVEHKPNLKHRSSGLDLGETKPSNTTSCTSKVRDAPIELLSLASDHVPLTTDLHKRTTLIRVSRSGSEPDRDEEGRDDPTQRLLPQD